MIRERTALIKNAVMSGMIAAVVAATAGCSLLTEPEGAVLSYAGAALLGEPVTGQVTFIADVTNEGVRRVPVSSDFCSVGYRLVPQSGLGETYSLDPRSEVCGLLLGGPSAMLRPGETLRLQSWPYSVAKVAPSGSYSLTILVAHDGRYREVPAGTLVVN